MSSEILKRGGARPLLAGIVATAVLLSTSGCTSYPLKGKSRGLSGAPGRLGMPAQAAHSCGAARAIQPNPPPKPQVRTIGWSVEGRPIECTILGDGADITLFLGTIHGNEDSGRSLLRRLADHLDRYPALLAGRQVMLVPVVNPDGLLRHTRYNARGVDLNRNFPADNWSGNIRSGERPLSEPETRAMHELLEHYQPDRVVAIHEGLTCVDYDGPGELWARAMSMSCDLPVRKVGGMPGSLGSYAGGRLGRPAITIELRRFPGRLSEDDLWARYGRMLLAGIEFPGDILAGATGSSK